VKKKMKTSGAKQRKASDFLGMNHAGLAGANLFRSQFGNFLQG
jgi:hypothetical protein